MSDAKKLDFFMPGYVEMPDVLIIAKGIFGNSLLKVLAPEESFHEVSASTSSQGTKLHVENGASLVLHFASGRTLLMEASQFSSFSILKQV